MRNKGGNPAPAERAKVRVVMVEFEGTSGDLQQLAQTLANAVRPQQIVMPIQAVPTQPALPATAAGNGTANGQTRDLFAEYEDADVADDGVEAASAPVAVAKPSAPKKLRTPQLISDLDFDSGPKSFKAYIDELQPSGHHLRYLAITQWFKEFRQVLEIGADHVFTCYRYLNLGVPPDVLLAFRQLKGKQWVEQGETRAHYKITHIGLNQLTQPKA